MSDQFVNEAAKYASYKKQNRKTSMSSARIETATPAIELPQAFALDHTATGINKLPFMHLNSPQIKRD
jgi:hypothetical protein